MVNIMTTIIFNEVNYTESSIKDLTMPQLVDLWNEIIDADSSLGTYVARFADRAIGQKRVWNLLQKANEVRFDQDGKALEPITMGVVEVTYPTEDDLNSDVDLVDEVKKAPKKAETKVPKNREINSISTQPLKPFKPNTKYDLMVQLLSKKEGTTIEELHTAVCSYGKPWPTSWVVAAIYDNLKGRGYSVKGRIENGVFILRLVNGN